MKRHDIKSLCPINFAVEVFGDPWSLLIVRGMAADGKKRFSEFLDTPERIGTSVLAERLTHLEAKQVITKRSDPDDKRKTIYSLTEQGLNALPILYEIAVWGSRTSPNPQAAEAWFKAMELDRQLVLQAWRKALKAGSSFYNGNQSVIRQLKL